MALSLEDVLADPIAFIQRLTINTKQGKKANLQLNEEQKKILASLITEEDTLVLKPRQIGSSTIVAAYLFWYIFTAKEPVTVAILSHKLSSSKHLFKMFLTFYDNLPEPLRRPLSVINSTEMRFADTGAGVIAASAGGKGGLRSFTCIKLWLSEFAFAPEPEELLATATSALNDGQLIIESTANYFNDAHYKEITKAEKGLASWQFLFFPWHEHAEYSLHIPNGFHLTEEEEALGVQYNLTKEQLHWRRKKIEKIGLEKFTREYPLTVEEAYQQLSNTYFNHLDLQYVDMLLLEARTINVLASPVPGDKYAVGVDVAAGVGRDYSVIFVLSKRTGQPVYIFRSNTITPVDLAARAQEVATAYNNAKILVESNNMGGVVLNELRHLGYTNIWKTEQGHDWQTTSKTKMEMFELLKKTISAGSLIQLDNTTVAELRALTVEKGRVVLPSNMDSHGDNAVALALAVVCLQSVKLPEKKNLPDWIISSKANRIRKNSGASVASYRRYN